MKIKAIAASTFKDHENGWSYSDSALVDLARSAQGKPVIYKKKRIGIIESGTYEDSRVIVTATINNPEEILNKELYLVPAGLTDFDTICDIIDTCVAQQFIFTEKPSDQTLTAFQKIE
jgi:hypothetical protein